MKYESHMRHWKSKNPCANSHPNFRSSVQGDVLSRVNPNLVLNSKSLVRGNLDKMKGNSLGYNNIVPISLIVLVLCFQRIIVELIHPVLRGYTCCS